MPDASGPASALATTAPGAPRAAPLPRRILHRQPHFGQEARDQVRGAADRMAIGQRPDLRPPSNYRLRNRQKTVPTTVQKAQLTTKDAPTMTAAAVADGPPHNDGEQMKTAIHVPGASHDSTQSS